MNNLTGLVLDYMQEQLKKRLGTEILGGDEELEDIIFASYREDGHIHALRHESLIEGMIMRDWDEYKEVVSVLIEEGILTEETSNPFINPRIVLDIVYQEMIYWLMREVNFTEDLSITANGVWLNEESLKKITDIMDGVRVIDSQFIGKEVRGYSGGILYS